MGPVKAGNHEARIWIRGSAIENNQNGNNTKNTVGKTGRTTIKKLSSLSSPGGCGGGCGEDDSVIIRTAAPWTWKQGVLLENSATTGIVVRLIDENGNSSKKNKYGATAASNNNDDTGNEIRLPPTAMKNGDVLLANNYPKAKDGSIVCPDDLISLTHLHEPSVIECLINRYEKDLIYTYTGPILLALNPFHNLNDLYSDATMRTYWHHAEQNTNEDLPPHVYAVSDATFRGMMRALEMSDKDKPIGCDQSILVSGESGAGKTVTMKFAMKYLAALSQRLAEFHAKHGKLGYLGIGKEKKNDERHIDSQRRTQTDPLALRGHTFAVKNQPSRYSPVSSSPRNGNNSKQGQSLASQSSLSLQTDSIENQVLQSNPILESFGNARTIRNDNSSRFGKFIELQFTRYGKLVGAQIQVYLLEKVRLVHQAPGERNYHIFFEFMSGGMDFRELKNYYLTSKHTPADFKITANGAYDRRDGVPDSDTYRELRRAMNIMKFSPDVQKNVFNVTAAILHASNLTWVEKNGDESAVDESNEHLAAVCDLLSVSASEMTQSLCYYSITAGGTRLRKSLSKEKAEHGFDALLKALYGALFAYLVRQINGLISYQNPPSEDNSADDPLQTPVSFIGILDIFGFESFQTNSFEQLCINYCNETLQLQFSSFILKNEQKEYEREGIKWDFIDFTENEDVLNLIEHRGTGIFGILDDMCRAPGTTDRVFADTLYKKCADSACFSADKKQSATLKFTIQHYAGPVEYLAEGFVEKNRDELPKESAEFLRKSGNEFVHELAKIIEGIVNVADSGTNKSRKSATTVGGHFRDQLNDLRGKIDKTSPHFVRCLKPNDLLVPNRFEIPVVAEQLRCGGVLEAVRVARAGFPQHYSHADFVRRYRPLVWKEWGRVVAGKATKLSDVCKNLLDVLSQKLQQLEKIEEKAKGLQSGDGPAFSKLGIQFGKSKVFLRQREFEGLERQRGHEQQKAAIKLNARFRGYLVRCKWAEYVPLLHKEKSDILKLREQTLFLEKEQQAHAERDLTDLAATFSGSSDQLLNSDQREMVATKVASKNPEKYSAPPKMLETLLQNRLGLKYMQSRRLVASGRENLNMGKNDPWTPELEVECLRIHEAEHNK